MDTATYIQELRTRLGLSKEAFGKLINKHRTTVHRYETGDAAPRLNDFFKIKELESVSVKELKRRRPELWDDNAA